MTAPAIAAYHQRDLDVNRRTSELDVTIVCGEGPVKPVLLSKELTEEQREIWATFTAAPLETREPDFFVVEGRQYLAQLEAIDAAVGPDDEQKTALELCLRLEWQRLGRFALKRLGRQNALAAGAALLTGVTRQLLLTGGRTKPKWIGTGGEGLQGTGLSPALKLRLGASGESSTSPELATWPSEAELMADIIRRHFGKAYAERYGRAIESALLIEAEASNTIENVVLSLNKCPALRAPSTRVGILSADHHLERCALLAKRFGLRIAEGEMLSAQRTLLTRTQAMKHGFYRQRYEAIEHHMMDLAGAEWTRDLVRGEARFIHGLTDDAYLTYWFGYVFELDDPVLVGELVASIRSDPNKLRIARQACEKVGLDPDALQHVDVPLLASTNPVRFQAWKQGMGKLITRRAMPPAETGLPQPLPEGGHRSAF